MAPKIAIVFVSLVPSYRRGMNSPTPASDIHATPTCLYNPNTLGLVFHVRPHPNIGRSGKAGNWRSRRIRRCVPVRRPISWRGILLILTFPFSKKGLQRLSLRKSWQRWTLPPNLTSLSPTQPHWRNTMPFFSGSLLVTGTSQRSGKLSGIGQADNGLEALSKGNTLESSCPPEL